MKPTYRAMQVTRPGVLEPVQRRTPTPPPGEVLIRVEACGVCGADLADIDGADPTLQPPRVPGHEVVGRLVALGAQVPPPCGGWASAWASAGWAGIARPARCAAAASSISARTRPSSAPHATEATPR